MKYSEINTEGLQSTRLKDAQGKERKGMIVNVLGNSGAGKDTCATLIANMLATRGVLSANLKFTRGDSVKDALEMVYGLPEGYLDAPSAKAEVVPGHPEGWTYGEVLVKMWELLPQVDATMLSRAKEREAIALLATGSVPIFTDIRNAHEVSMILNLTRHTDTRLITFLVSSTRETPKASDAGCKRYARKLGAYGYLFFILNDRSLYELETDLKVCIDALFPVHSYPATLPVQ